MTHDELLTEIDRLDKVLTDSYGIKALRAVVKLHKPGRCNQDCCDVCSHCFEIEGERADIYPCPTIQAIEKELM